MKKQKVKFMDEIEFSSSEYAKQLYIKENKKLKFKIICALISLLTPLVFILLYTTKKAGIELVNNAFSEMFFTVLFCAGIGATIISNPLQIVKTTWKLMLFGWYIVPIVFIDLIAVIFCLWFSMIALFFIPTIHCAIGIYQSYRNKKDAEVYCMLNNVGV